VISDIERIKKVIEILEFLGEKVGDVIQNLPTPSQSAQNPTFVSTDDVRTVKEDAGSDDGETTEKS
jgi:hypothetical protein